MEYKRTYTKEEAEEIIRWFDAHECNQEVDLGHGLVVENIKHLINQSRNIVLKKYDNPTYSGQIQFLYHLQEVMIEKGLVND